MSAPEKVSADEELPASKVCAYVECGRTFTRGNRTKYRWRHTRFCSQDCGRRGVSAGPARRALCGRSKHPMSGNNVRIDPRNGRRSCKACQSEQPARQGAEQAEAPASGLVGPGWEAGAAPWRPPGWSPTPNVLGTQ